MVRSTVRVARIPRLALAAVAVCLLTLSSSCGVLDRFAGEAIGSPQPAPPEKPRLRVGILPIVDTAGFQIAMDKGYFQQEGLDIEIVPIQGGRAATPKLATGELDVTWGNWASYLDSQARGEADLALLTDGYQADEGMFLTVAMPGRDVNGPEDLRGKRIAVNTRNNIVELNLMASLQAYGIRAQDVQLVEVPFPQMPEKLRTGAVDAATVLEPFLSKANQLGAQTVLDTAAGPTQDIPIAGFSSTKQFAAENPNTVAAFQRAMIRGQTLASENRDEVEEVLPKFTDTDPRTASLVRLGTFPRTLDLTRLNRIKTLMQLRNLLPANFEIGPMIIPTPAVDR